MISIVIFELTLIELYSDQILVALLCNTWKKIKIKIILFVYFYFSMLSSLLQVGFE